MCLFDISACPGSLQNQKPAFLFSLFLKGSPPVTASFCPQCAGKLGCQPEMSKASAPVHSMGSTAEWGDRKKESVREQSNDKKVSFSIQENNERLEEEGWKKQKESEIWCLEFCPGAVRKKGHTKASLLIAKEEEKKIKSFSVFSEDKLKVLLLT